MANLEAGNSVPPVMPHPDESCVEHLFRARYLEMVRLAGLLDFEVGAAITAREPAFIAKYAFELAQAFNLFYHRHRMLSETDAARRTFLLRVSRLVERQLVAALDVLGIEAPEKM